jgi:hypothetical protein
MTLKDGQKSTYIRKGSSTITGITQQPATPVQNTTVVWDLPKNQTGIVPFPQPEGCNSAVVIITAALTGALFFSSRKEEALAKGHLHIVEKLLK